jgi:preprotein translocase SecE subunit
MALAKAQPSGVGERALRPFVKLVQFLQSVWFELQRVVWPSKSENWAFTVVTIIAVVTVALYMGILDGIVGFIARKFLGLY